MCIIPRENIILYIVHGKKCRDLGHNSTVQLYLSRLPATLESVHGLVLRLQ